MSKYNHVSFDIETLDVCASAVVLSIGAALFNLDEQDTYDDIRNYGARCFYASIEMQTQIDRKRTISADTIAWWMSQSQEAKQVFSESKYQVPQALVDLQAFCAGTSFAWGNGNMFDNVIIRSLFNSFDMDYPYHYVRDMDLRTLKVAAGSPKISVASSSMTKHNALDDAVFQAVLAQQFQHAIKSRGVSNG